jgi:diadenosine tetraphosphate (Ap4A) HIT family hydrolase
MGSLMWGAPLPGSPFMGVLNQFFSPYQTNPLDINPLRKLLERVVDFEALTHPPMEGVVPKIFVCATNVRTGRGCIFSGKKLSADAVMASACLPQLFKAVEIDGEPYWDGGFSGNPALYPLIYGTVSSDILLVQINPIEHHDLPNTAADIMDRMNEVTFNAGLLAELRAIEFVKRLLEQGKLDPARYKKVLLHRVDGGAVLRAMAPRPRRAPTCASCASCSSWGASRASNGSSSTAGTSASARRCRSTTIIPTDSRPTARPRNCPSAMHDHDPNCLFCRITKGEIPSRKVYEDDEVFAFHDIHPGAPIHFLMVPKKHIPSMAQVQAEDAPLLGRLMALAPRLAAEQGCNPYPEGGFRLVVNTGTEGGQEVHHLHIHVMGGPRPWLKG